MGKKKIKPRKTEFERTTEVVQIRKKMMEIGFHKEQLPEIKDLIDILEDYRKNGTPWSGKIKLQYISKNIEGFLTNSKGRQNVIRITDF